MNMMAAMTGQPPRSTWPPGILLADHACEADRPGICALRCGHAITIGQRVARLIDGTGWAHLGCIDAMQPTLSIHR
jgi:hypothetical protein